MLQFLSLPPSLFFFLPSPLFPSSCLSTYYAHSPSLSLVTPLSSFYSFILCFFLNFALLFFYDFFHLLLPIFSLDLALTFMALRFYVSFISGFFSHLSFVLSIPSLRTYFTLFSFTLIGLLHIVSPCVDFLRVYLSCFLISLFLSWFSVFHLFVFLAVSSFTLASFAPFISSRLLS